MSGKLAKDLIEKTKTYEIYQNLLQECMEAEKAYNEISLLDEQREIIERYLSACEELEHRCTTLALSVGT